MILGQIERYTIEQLPGRVVIRMRQRSNALGALAVALAVIAASWWFGPHGPRPTGLEGGFYWFWMALWGFFVAMSVLGIFYREDWAITDTEVTVRKSSGGTGKTRRMPRGRTLGIQIERRRSSSRSGKSDVFPWRVHFLDANASVSRLHLDFQKRSSVDQLIAACRPVISMNVHDPSGSER
jgi:hypothetical protein